MKQKQINKLFRQATVADAPMRPLLVVLEDLNVDGMKRNRKLALAISDVGLAEFKRQMAYKIAGFPPPNCVQGVGTSKRTWTSRNASTCARIPHVVS